MMPTADTTVNCQKGIDVVAIAMLSCREGQVESTGRLEGVGWVARQSSEAGDRKTALTACSGRASEQLQPTTVQAIQSRTAPPGSSSTALCLVAAPGCME